MMSSFLQAAPVAKLHTMPVPYTWQQVIVPGAIFHTHAGAEPALKPGYHGLLKLGIHKITAACS